MKPSATLPPSLTQPRALEHWRYTARPLELFDEAKKLGDAFTLRLLNAPPIVVFSHPDAVRELFTGSTDDLYAGDANRVLESVVGKNSLLLLDGPRHLRERKLLMPPFHGERMHAYGELMRDSAARTVDRWPLHTPFTLLPHTSGITLEVILRTVFGVGEGPRLGALSDDVSALIRGTTHPALFAILLAVPGELFRSVMAVGIEPEAPRWKRALRRALPLHAQAQTRARIDAMLFDEIRRRRDEGTAGRTDVLSLLVDARHDDGSPMSDQQLLDQMITLLLAGHETSAVTLAFAMQRILEHPDVLAKLRAELDAVTGGAPLDPRDVGKLVYLDAVIKESMRFDTLLTLVVRTVQRELTIGGYSLPAGTIAATSPVLLHQRADLWPEPTKFRPERFLDRKVSAWEWLPFGGGSRRCLGAAFATYEMKVVLATLLGRAELKLADPGPLRTVRRGVVLAPEGGVRLVMTARRAPREARTEAALLS